MNLGLICHVMSCFKRQSLISEYFLYNPSQLQKNHLRLQNRFLSQFPINWESKSTLRL